MSVHEVWQPDIFQVGDRIRTRSGGLGGTVVQVMSVPLPLMTYGDDDVIIQNRPMAVVHLDFAVDLQGKLTYCVHGDASTCFEHE